MAIEYLLCASTVSALPEMSPRKARPDASTHAQLYNQARYLHTVHPSPTQVRDMCFLLPTPP